MSADDAAAPPPLWSTSPPLDASPEQPRRRTAPRRTAPRTPRLSFELTAQLTRAHLANQRCAGSGNGKLFAHCAADVPAQYYVGAKAAFELQCAARAADAAVLRLRLVLRSLAPDRFVCVVAARALALPPRQARVARRVTFFVPPLQNPRKLLGRNNSHLPKFKVQLLVQLDDWFGFAGDVWQGSLRSTRASSDATEISEKSKYIGKKLRGVNSPAFLSESDDAFLHAVLRGEPEPPLAPDSLLRQFDEPRALPEDRVLGDKPISVDEAAAAAAAAASAAAAAAAATADTSASAAAPAQAAARRKKVKAAPRAKAKSAQKAPPAYADNGPQAQDQESSLDQPAALAPQQRADAEFVSGNKRRSAPSSVQELDADDGRAADAKRAAAPSSTKENVTANNGGEHTFLQPRRTDSPRAMSALAQQTSLSRDPLQSPPSHGSLDEAFRSLQASSTVNDPLLLLGSPVHLNARARRMSSSLSGNNTTSSFGHPFFSPTLGRTRSMTRRLSLNLSGNSSTPSSGNNTALFDDFAVDQNSAFDRFANSTDFALLDPSALLND